MSASGAAPSLPSRTRSPGWLLALASLTPGAAPAAPRQAVLPASGGPVAVATRGAPGEDGAPQAVVRVLVGASGSFGHTDQSARLELAAARRAGVETIFWTASDAMVGTGREVAHFSLDGPDEPVEAGEAWTPLPGIERGGRKEVTIQEPRVLSRSERMLRGPPVATAHAFDLEDARDGTPSLLLTLGGSNTEAFRDLAALVAAERGAHRRSMALDVRARLHVLPLELSRDGRVFAEFRLSKQPFGPGGHGVAEDVLHYYLSNGGEEVTVVGGTVFLPVPYEPGVWNELELDLSADAVAHAAGGADNLLYQVRLGVESRFQHPAAARFDQLTLEQGVAGPEALERQAEVLGTLGSDPGVAAAMRLQGLRSDVLRGPALYELGASPVPTDYGALLADPEGTTEAFAALVTRAHARGSLVAYGSPLAPPSDGATSAASWLAGADLLLFDPDPEALPRQIALWDGLAVAGLFPVGLGGGGELGQGRSPITSGVRGLAGLVLAASPGREDVLAALARGRAAFGDPAAFDGGLDLKSERGFAMGQIVLTDRAAAVVALERLGSPKAGEVVDWYTSRGLADSFDADAPRPVELDALPDFARAVVLGSRAQPVAYSNALHFVRAFPPGGLPAERAGFDVAGVRSRSGEHLTLLGVRASEDGRGVVIDASARGDGTLLLSLGSDGPAAIAWDGLSGKAEQEGERLRLFGLSGDGSLTVRSAP